MYKQKIFPTFISSQEREVKDLAESMITILQNQVGVPLDEVQALIIEKVGSSAHHPHFQGLKKLLFDRCSHVQNDDGEFEEKRWQLILAAQRLRKEVLFTTKEEFQETFSQQENLQIKEMEKNLYSDLPQHLPVLEFEPITADELIHRYNCALVQGLLIHARNVRFILQNPSLVEKRSLFKVLKFSQLLVDEVENDGDTFSFTVNGALSIFENAASYSMRVANFFPYILQLSNWDLQASIHLKSKDLSLQLNSSEHPIGSHYRPTSSYIPQEFCSFMEHYNKKPTGWSVSPGDEFMDLGHQIYCFPDMTFEKEDKTRKIHLELFHKWHSSQFIKRLEAMTKTPVNNLIIGVSHVIAKKNEVKECLEKFSELREKVFVFKDFPSALAVDKLLLGVGAGYLP